MRRSIAGLLCLFASSITLADVLLELAGRNSFAGHFTQQVLSPDGVILETAAGQFRMLRPDFFWWQIETPDRQLLLAAGNKITQIDWDLEIVTEREITDETRTVLHWLLAPRSELEDTFAIELSDSAAMLTPLETGMGFLRLGVSRINDADWQLRITDLSHQVLEFVLTEDPERSLDVSAFDVPETAF